MSCGHGSGPCCDVPPAPHYDPTGWGWVAGGAGGGAGRPGPPPPAAGPTGVVRLGPIAMDIGARRVTVGETPVELTPREYELLKVMMAQPGRLLTQGRLLRAVWGTAYAGEAHYLHVYVSRLRRKLAAADPSGAVKGLIASEPGIGYRVGDPTVRR